MALRFIDSDGNAPISQAVFAVLYAISKGADIISNSWGSSIKSRALEVQHQTAAIANHVVAEHDFIVHSVLSRLFRIPFSYLWIFFRYFSDSFQVLFLKD
jgi:hypothetical protein